MQITIRVEVKFFSESQGGRRQLPADMLSSGIYRPHFVVGAINQERAIVNERNEIVEHYLGVVFVSQDAPLVVDKPAVAEIKLPYLDVDYSQLTSGATFTIREGSSIAGNGKVL